MSEKITVPTLGESVTEATVSKWLKSQGDKVTADEPIVELETDKVNVEVPAPSNGILGSIAVAAASRFAGQIRRPRGLGLCRSQHGARLGRKCLIRWIRLRHCKR